MSTVNNFDTSSTGINIEGSFFYDTDISRMYFDETFDKIKNGLLFYNGHDQIKDDVSFTVKGNKSNLIEFLNMYVGDYDWKDNSKSELLDEVINNLDVSLENFETISNDLKDYRIELVPSTPIEKIITRGYSQGDYLEVLYFPEKLKELWGNDVDESSLQTDIDHLCWDTPIYGNVTINDVEFLYEGDPYEWEREKYIKSIIEHYEGIKDHKPIKMETLISELEEIVPKEITYQ